jgi:uncharacterized membrane protein YbhN (UPF0104 family)
MSTAAVDAVTPFHDRSRLRRLLKVAAWLAGIAVLLIVLDLLGVDVTGWFSQVWDTLTTISAGAIVAGLALQTVQTTLTALAWFFILRAAYPDADFPYRQILAAYAAGVAMNGFLPANIGTFVSLLMYTALISGAAFVGVVGGMVVQKIFFTIAGTFVYLYLFLSVGGSFSLQLGGISDHPVFTVLVIVGGVFTIVLLCRIFWRKLQHLWEDAKQGGAILAHPRDYLLLVALPSFGAWLAKLGVTAVFLGAYDIPVTFHSVMTVIGGNSLANTVSATPGGVGVNQAINAASLSSVTDTATATAYSIGQQLIVTAWNIVFGVALVVWAFGWTGGKMLVQDSYAGAKTKVAEQKAQHSERKAEKRAQREREGSRVLHRLRAHRSDDPETRDVDDG